MIGITMTKSILSGVYVWAETVTASGTAQTAAARIVMRRVTQVIDILLGESCGRGPPRTRQYAILYKSLHIRARADSRPGSRGSAERRGSARRVDCRCPL